MDAQYLTSIILRISKADEKAFSSFFDYFYPRCFRLALYYIHSDELAEEIVLDVFTSLWNNRKRLPKIQNFDNYLYTAVKNQSLAYIRKKKISKVSLGDYKGSKLIEYVEPEGLFLGKELAKELEIAISALPPRCQLIFRMIRENNMKYQEVAELLSISLKGVENQITIAIKRIQGKLTQYNAEPKEQQKSNL